MSFNRRVALLALAALIAASLACGSGSSTPPTTVPVQQEQPTQAPPEPTQAPQQPTKAPQTDNNTAPEAPEVDVPKNTSVTNGSTLDVVNNTDFTVCYLYISPTTSDQWGSDWLGEYVLDPGYTFTVEVTSGDYDILVTDCNDNVIEEHYGETLGDQPRTWDLVGSGGNVVGGGGNTSAEFTIYNEGTIDICWLWVSPTTDTEWGYEWLGDTFILSPGYYFTETVQSGYYDLLGLDCNGDVIYEEYGIIMGDQPRSFYLGQ